MFVVLFFSVYNISRLHVMNKYVLWGQWGSKHSRRVLFVLERSVINGLNTTESGNEI